MKPYWTKFKNHRIDIKPPQPFLLGWQSCPRPTCMWQVSAFGLHRGSCKRIRIAMRCWCLRWRWADESVDVGRVGWVELPLPQDAQNDLKWFKTHVSFCWTFVRGVLPHHVHCLLHLNRRLRKSLRHNLQRHSSCLAGLEKPRKGGAPPSKDFYESCAPWCNDLWLMGLLRIFRTRHAPSEVDGLWQNGLMRLENRAAEVDLRGRPLSCHVSHVWNDSLKWCETVLRIQKDRKSGILPWTYSFRMMVKLG